MDRFKWYSSHSIMMDQLSLSGSSIQKSFIDGAFDLFKNKTGINSLLYVYLRMNKHRNKLQNFYEIYFSVDGKLLEIKDFNPDINGEPFYVVEVKTGKTINTSLYNNAMNFILEYIVMRDGMNIKSQMSQGKAIAILQVDFNEMYVDTEAITRALRWIFDKHFIDIIGPMG